MTTQSLHLGDALAVLPTLPAESVDAVVTDPPYGITFMGNAWDRAVPPVAIWREVLRILKPGGHLLSFGGPRTYHRMACAIEDAGFEIRDQVMWIFGEGFPKSHDIGKAIDKAEGVQREIVGYKIEPDGRSMATEPRANARIRKGSKEGRIYGGDGRSCKESKAITIPTTPAAKEWNGWGSALKPAHEPICVARKPFDGTLAANVVKNGTGAINIDACRTAGRDRTEYGLSKSVRSQGFAYGTPSESADFDSSKGRWPANILLDAEAAALLDAQSGYLGAGAHPAVRNTSGYCGGLEQGATPHGAIRTDAGGASRFFYCAKASPADRHEGLSNPGPQFQAGNTLQKVEQLQSSGNLGGNNHPTVKPTDLMRWLCTLICPPGGTVLDPFMGSGSTGRGAVLAGFHFVGIEIEANYYHIAKRRIAAAAAQQMLVFDEEGRA